MTTAKSMTNWRASQMPKSDFKTEFPVTLLTLLGREWHAAFFVDRARNGCVGSMTAGIRNDAERAAESALGYDY